MLSAGLETLLRMIGWFFLPGLGARTLLNIYRQLCIVLPPKFGYQPRIPPPEKSPEHIKQQRASFALVILLYLLYTTVQSYLQAPPNFYALLSVSPTVDESTLKSAFRNYARVNHPDRVGVQGEQKFIEARDAYDVLKSEIRRWAYDRFGPEVIGWEKECTSVGDYLERGLMASCGFYIVSAVAMTLYAIFGQSGFGAFWRYNLFFSLIAIELLLILSPPFESLRTIFPGRVAYQHIKFLHQLFISLSIAITRIGPTILPSFSGSPSSQAEWEKERTALYTVVQQISAVAARLDREISRMIWRELKAAHGENEVDASVGEISLDSPIKRTSIANGSIPKTGTPLLSSEVPNGTTSSTPAAGLGGIELDDQVMRRLSKEVEDMVIEKHLKRHPMLARIWAEGVEVGRRDYMKEKEDRRKEGWTSQRTTVDPQQDLNGSEEWKREYMNRRARSEEHSPGSSPSPSLRGLGKGRAYTYGNGVGSVSQPVQLRNTPPPPGELPTEGRDSSPVPFSLSANGSSSLPVHKESPDNNDNSGSSLSMPVRQRPTLELSSRPSSELSKKAETERIKRRERFSSFSPGPSSFSPRSSSGGNRLSAAAGSFGELAGDTDSSIGPLSVRSRSMSLVG